MPDGYNPSDQAEPQPGVSPSTEPAAPQLSARPGRPPLIAFVNDASSGRAISDGLLDRVTGEIDVRRGGIRAAIASMRKAATPDILVVDISGEDQPLTALAELAEVVEPDVCVLVIGELDSVDFYREVTRSLGAHDYLAKPLTKDKVARHFGTLVAGHAPATGGLRGGGLVIITGVHGGVGATTIAANLAGHFGVSMHRHTVLLDPDLHGGDAAFLLNVKPGPGLRTALEAPDRIDALLAERAALPVVERLHVLAGEEALSARLSYAPNAAAYLMAALRRRYSFTLVDLPLRPQPLYEDLLGLVHQRVLVMVPTLASVRATLRLMAVSMKPDQVKRPVIVLNRLGLPGGLTRRQIEEALAAKVDVVITDQPRQVSAAAAMGELAMNTKGGFRNGIMELARQVAFVGLLDSTAGTAAVTKPAETRRRWLFLRWKS